MLVPTFTESLTTPTVNPFMTGGSTVSLLNRGTEVVTVCPDEIIIDEDGNKKMRPERGVVCWSWSLEAHHHDRT